MELYKHIYVYKTMLKIWTIKKNYESNSNSNGCNILHLTFDMLCHFCRMKVFTVRDALIWVPITICDIGIYASSFCNILKTIKKDMQVKIIIYGYKYQWNQSHKRNIK